MGIKLLLLHFHFFSINSRMKELEGNRARFLEMKSEIVILVEAK